MRGETSWLPIILAAIFIIVAWFANLIALHDLPPEARGTYGDMFGAVNSLFSGGALAGVIYAIFLQRKEVEITREELLRTKHMLAQQTEALQRDEITRTFFSMLGHLNRLKNDIYVEVTKGPAEQRTKELYQGERALRDIIIAQRQMLMKPDKGLQFARERYESFARGVEMVAALVERLPENERSQYARILLSTLSHADK